MEKYTLEDQIHKGTWHYGFKEVNGKKVGLLVTFTTDCAEKINPDEAVKNIRAGLDHLKALGCDYAMIPGPAINPALILYHMKACPECRAFQGTEEITDLKALESAMAAQVKADTPLVCVVPPEKSVEPIWLHFPLNGPVPNPFAYLVTQPDGTAVVVADKPEKGEYVATTEFRPGDEKVYRIEVKGPNEIQAVLRSEPIK